LLNIEQIRNLLSSGMYELTRHAFHRIVERDISENEIISCNENAEIIEDYPTDKYGPSCLLLGLTNDNRPLHIQVSRKEQPKLKIITIYEPDPNEWENFRTRRVKL
jgi:hypothetical protein